MSFKKAQQVVQTCVLSKRWRHLWRSVPCLDIDHDEFKKTACASEDGVRPGVDPNAFNTVIASDDYSDSHGDTNSNDILDDDSDRDGPGSNLVRFDDDNHKEKDKDWEDFEDFTANLMLRCNIAQLDSFGLHIIGSRAPEFGDRQAAGWLRRALKYCAPDRASQHVGLSSGSWRLKRLHLCHVLLDNHFIKHVMLLCHYLEDLDLDDCTCKIRSITSDLLKTLVLKNCRWHNLSKITSTTLKTLVIDGGSNTDRCVLVILAPAVTYLHPAASVYHFRGGISINEVTSPAKALIHMQSHGYGAYGQFKFLCSISKATSLELSGVGAKVLAKEPTFLGFKNLRNLLLDNCDLSDNFHTLAFFLQISPILEKLTLRHCKFPKCPNTEYGTPILRNITSSALRGVDLLCENLKVEIIWFM